MKNLPLSFLFFWVLSSLTGLQFISAQSNKDSIKYYYQAINNPNASTDLAKSLDFYNSKKDRNLKIGDTLGALKDLRLLAIGYYNLGSVYESENASVQALLLIESNSKNDTLNENKKAIFNQLGQVYRATNNHDKAIETYNLALKYAKNKSDSISLINNKANIYKDKTEYKKAADILQTAYKKMGATTDSIHLAYILDNLGYVQSQLNDPNALTNLKLALKIRLNKKQLTGIYSSYRNLALHYFATDSLTQAMNYADMAYNTASTINSSSYLENALSLYAMMSTDKKIQRYKQLTDSIAKEKQLAENKNTFIKYNVEKERKKTAEMQLQKEKEKGQKLLYMSLGIFIIFLASIIILFLRAKHKKEKIIQIYNTEARISKVVHDEVANDLYHVMVKLQQQEHLQNEEIIDDIEHIYNKTRDISKENSAIEINENFGKQLSDLLLSYQTENVKIVTRNIQKIEWQNIPEIKKPTIYRVLQELMTNMKKHSSASIVVISFLQNTNRISIDYSDNGQGCELKNKNGLLNAENRIKTFKGTIIFDTKPGKGFKAKITL